MDNRKLFIAESTAYGYRVSIAREGTQQEIERRLDQALDHMEKKHKERRTRLLPTTTIRDYLLDNTIVIDIGNTYLAALDIVTPWFSTERILQELLLYRYSTGMNTKDMIGFLSWYSKELHCDSVEVGTLAARGRHHALERLYRSAGMETDYIAMRLTNE